jgi:glycine oxidase
MEQGSHGMRGERIVVAGAGAIGAAVACQLALAGCAVTVVDSAAAGDNASGVAAGMLAPAFESLFDDAVSTQHTLLAAARDRWPALADAAGLELARDGALAAGTQRQADGWHARLAESGADARVLGPAAAARLAAGLAPNAWAVFAPGDWRLDPRSALVALARLARSNGAAFRRARVLGFDGRRVELEGARPLRADLLVIATGAADDLATLAPELLRLAPIKGHIIRAAAAVKPQPVIRAPGLYVCRADGEMIVGATMEPGRADRAVDPLIVERLIAAAAPYVGPGLGPLDWRAETGVRAGTADGLPLVGSSRAPGVILAVGARRNGWLLAPLIADVVLAHVGGRTPPPVAAAFDPARPIPG